MGKQIRQGCIVTLLSIICVVVGVYVLLRMFDPFGAIRLNNDLERLYSGYVKSDRIYSLYPGDYQFTNWNAHIDHNGNRAVPDSKPAACSIAFLGDSVTFGFGVNDKDTFVNQLASQINAQLINAALVGYNSENIRAALADIEADGYIYMIIGNDDEPTHHWMETEPRSYLGSNPDIFGVHYIAFGYHYGEIERDRERFEADLAALMARDDVLLVGFQDHQGWYKQLPEGVILLPFWTQSVSAADGHPNPHGHQQIADGLLPHVQAFQQRVCK